jgi:hypothetical protein
MDLSSTNRVTQRKKLRYIYRYVRCRGQGGGMEPVSTTTNKDCRLYFPCYMKDVEEYDVENAKSTLLFGLEREEALLHILPLTSQRKKGVQSTKATLLVILILNV